MLTPAILKDLLSSPKKIFITTHRKPDGDALGSSLGLYFYLLKKGHEPIVVAPTDYPTFLHWMPGNDSVIIWDEERKNQENI
ncbi:MAG: DHH family phosphoesterase [Bacteroidetes bacterium]|nr:DHH family phosphoesterase [Bacteroidota bacterium]